jgi:hypothetical protein
MMRAESHGRETIVSNPSVTVTLLACFDRRRFLPPPRFILPIVVVFAVASLLCCEANAKRERWEGKWAYKPAWCNQQRKPNEIYIDDPAPIDISKTEVVGLEYGCDVLKVERLTNGTRLALKCNGEGMEWRDKMMVRVVPTGLLIWRQGDKPDLFSACAN